MSESSLSILYIDYDPLLVTIVKKYLTQQGFNVDIATTGNQAFQKITNFKFDVIVSDYEVQGIDGIKLLKETRKKYQDTSFILFTGGGSEELVLEAIENGVDFYIRKKDQPYLQCSDLTYKIRLAVQQRQQARECRESEWKFRALVDYSLDGTFILDPWGTILFANTTAIKILEIQKPDELIGKRNVLEFITPESMDDVTRDFTTVAGGVDGYIALYKIFTENHKERWVESIGKTIQYQNAQSILISMRDVTDQKQAEDKLHFTQEKYKKAFLSSPDAIIISELETGKFIEVNNATSKIYGYSPEEMIGKSARDLNIWVRPDDHDAAISLIKIQGRIERLELIERRKSGEHFYALMSSEIIILDGIEHLLSTISDITEQKKSEDTLRESEHKLITLFMNNPIALSVVSAKNGVFVDVNEAFIRNTGFTREQVIGSTAEALELFPDRDQHHHMISLLRDQKALYGFNISCKTANGEIRLCQFSSRIIMMGGSPHILSSIEDITESSAAKSAFEALVRSMVGTTGINSFQEITENIGSWLNADCVMIGAIQPDKKNINVLSMLLDGKETSGFSYPLKGTPCEDVIENGFHLYSDNIAELFPESQELRKFNIRGYVGTPLYNSEGDVFGILCALFHNPLKPPHSVQDIMDIIAIKAASEIERTQIEQTLRKNQQMLAEAMNLANLVSWEYNVIEDYFTLNDQFYALYGTNAEREDGYQMVPETYIREFIHPEDISLVTQEMKNAKHTSDPDFLSQREHRIIRRDGEIRYITVRIRVIQDTQGRTIKIHGVNQDITDRRKSEELVLKTNRQLKLLSGITRHDILNNISIIYVYLELVKQKYPYPDLLEYLRIMITVTEEIQSQIEFTRVYEELGSHEPLWVQLDTVMPRSSLPDSITLSVELKDIYVFADPMIKKVFFALLDNSIRHGQHVTMIQVSTIRSENTLTIIWEDNGIGISDTEKTEIFKQGAGKNTGLGLFLVREILSLTKITISETGILGTGARFEICVPKGAFKKTASSELSQLRTDI